MDDQSLESHFAFGENWERFLPQIDEHRVASATSDIAAFLGVESLAGKAFLDIGCGSGLSSVAAWRLGAKSIVSVDIDPKNIANTERLKRKFGVPDSYPWRVFQTSILGPEAANLPPADIVYSWGVLHHTGAMWKALDNCLPLVAPGGRLFLMLYRDAVCAPVWRRIKRTYTRSGPILQTLMRRLYASILVAGLLAKGRNPLRVMRDYAKSRGMSWYIDLTDWIGGYPFEWASAEETIAHMRSRGFELIKIDPAITPRPLGWYAIASYQYLFHRL